MTPSVFVLESTRAVAIWCIILCFPTIFSGKIPRLPWSFKPEQAKGNYIFKPQQGDDWQTGIGHCDTKTKPKRLIISDVDGEHFSVLTNKGPCCAIQMILFLLNL
jgi:hypothetical protein